MYFNSGLVIYLDCLFQSLHLNEVCACPSFKMHEYFSVEEVHKIFSPIFPHLVQLAPWGDYSGTQFILFVTLKLSLAHIALRAIFWLNHKYVFQR